VCVCDNSGSKGIKQCPTAMLVASKAQKCSGTDSSSLLRQAGILQHVLGHVGPGHWRFVAEVSSLWREAYNGVASIELQVIDEEFYETKTITCLPQMTLYSEVFASPSRARLAQAHDLDYTTEECERAAGMYADVATLEAAHELGMAYTETVMGGAVHSNKLTVVQFLQSQGCPLDESMFRSAAARGDVALCAYLHAVQCPWEADACTMAATHGHAVTFQWLHEHGCSWHPSYIHLAAAQGGSIDVMLYLQQARHRVHCWNADQNAECRWSAQQASSSEVAETARRRVAY
jgi:hypothetical protein